jgi:transposase
LTETRTANPWLAAGSQTVRQQSLKDFAPAMTNFYAGTHRRPTWRNAAIARLKAREADRRKDGVEKTSTGLARRFGVIAVEDLNTAAMTRSGKGPVDADVNAARNIRDTAVGRTVAARGGGAAARPVNREPQPALLPV